MVEINVLNNHDFNKKSPVSDLNPTNNDPIESVDMPKFDLLLKNISKEIKWFEENYETKSPGNNDDIPSTVYLAGVEVGNKENTNPNSEDVKEGNEDTFIKSESVNIKVVDSLGIGKDVIADDDVKLTGLSSNVTQEKSLR